MTKLSQSARLEAMGSRIIRKGDRLEREERARLLDPKPWVGNFKGLRRHLHLNRDRMTTDEARTLMAQMIRLNEQRLGRKPKHIPEPKAKRIDSSAGTSRVSPPRKSHKPRVGIIFAGKRP